MIDRIIKIRGENGLSQEKFAKRMGLSRNFINQVENGKKNFSDRTILDICREFNINEKWLRTGQGEMRTEDSQEMRFATNIAKLQRTNDETLIKWANAIAETNPELLRQIEALMKKMLGIE